MKLVGLQVCICKKENEDNENGAQNKIQDLAEIRHFLRYDLYSQDSRHDQISELAPSTAAF